MKNLFFILLIMSVLMTVFSCETADPKIYELDHLSYFNNNPNIEALEYLKKKDYFVIRGCPQNQSDQWDLIWSYCDSSMSKNDKLYSQYFRYFYHETNYTPIDYRDNETDYFNIDRIENHSKDLILRIEWHEGEPFECIFVQDGEIILISKICQNEPCKFER